MHHSWLRPWLAAFLGLVPGLGLLYLGHRRLALHLAARATVALFALLGLVILVSESDTPPALTALLLLPPGVVLAWVVLQSSLLSYIAARAEQTPTDHPGRVPVGDAPADRPPRMPGARSGETGDGDATARRLDSPGRGSAPGRASARDTGEDLRCPNCGRSVRDDLDFCPWCAAYLDDSRED